VIGNNLGKINGAVHAADIRGRVVGVIHDAVQRAEVRGDATDPPNPGSADCG